MDAERIELAVQRIEAALTRIGAVADQPPSEGSADSGSAAAVQERHDALHSTVSATLAELDNLIGKLGA